jgi:hypothetical protein
VIRQTHPGDPAPRGRGGRPWTGYAAAAFMLVLVTAALVAWLVGGGDGRPALPEPITNPPVSEVPGPGTASGSPEDGDQTLSAPPAGVVWQSWRAASLPYSPTAGPREVEGAVASGFSRTPAGALLAAVHTTARLTLAPNPGWEKAVETMALANEGRDKWVAARKGVTITAAPAPGTLAQIAGFQITSYNPDDAAIQLVTKSSDSSLSVSPVHVRWHDGDWKVVMTGRGGLFGTRTPLTDLNGFIAWGAVQ